MKTDANEPTSGRVEQVTFVLGWCDDDGAFVCADSAVTHNREPLGPTSSFGEAQQLDSCTVEESAVKILELPQDALVAVCGDAMAALGFVLSVRDRLLYTEKPLRTIVTEVGSAAGRRSRFQLLFGHRINGIPVLTVFDNENGDIENVGRKRFATFGSLPDEKTTLAAQLVNSVLQHGLTADARLAASLVVLQSMGITEYLPQYGIGGAFFGAYVSHERVVWQQDLDYLTYTPDAFASAPIVDHSDPNITIPSTSAIGKIRVLVRDGAGLLLSSLGSPAARLLIPPLSERTEAEWKDIVLAAVPPPFRLTAPSRHTGLLSVRHSKAIYIYNPGLRDGSFVVGDRSGLVSIEAEPRLVETIARDVPLGSCDLTIVTEHDNGTSAKTYRIGVAAQ
jgi:hypothetical protein